jgi:hypothetical protein
MVSTTNLEFELSEIPRVPPGLNRGVTSCDFRKEEVLNFGGRFEFLKTKMAVLAGVFNIV